MQIIFNIAENSNIELIKGEYELVQGECCVTELKFNFPATIKGIAIGNYKKRIEFGECKDLGECAKFIDDINGDTYELGENCTAFKKIMVQLVLTYNNIKWKTIPVALEFNESVNAEGNTVIQAQLLSLSAIEREWENYIKANTFRVITRAADIPTADASSEGEAIFYLSANTDTAPYLVYGHYYKCNYVNGVYEWTDLTQDASLAGVADGIREVNKNQTLQFWKGTTKELENEVPQENVAYIVEDEDLHDILEDVVPDIVVHKADSAGSVDNVSGGLPLIEISTLSGNKGFEVRETGIYCVVYSYTNSNGGISYYTDFIAIHDLMEGSTGDKIFSASGELYMGYENPTDDSKTVQRSPVLAYGHTASAYATTDKGHISFSTNFLTQIAYGGNYNLVKAYKLMGLTFTKRATIAIGSELSAAVDYAYHSITFVACNTDIAVGDKLSYEGEQAEITEYDEDYDTYTLKCAIGGKFAAAEGSSIEVEVE